MYVTEEIKVNRYATDCFAYSESKSGRPRCNALVELDCKGCRFFKTTEQQELDVKRAEILRQSRMIVR